jgi:hypothetical protein
MLVKDLAISVISLFSLSTPSLAAGLLDLRIPQFNVENVTMEEALMDLRAWGIPVCFEESRPHSDDPERLSLSLTKSSIRKILDELVMQMPNTYYWEEYRSLVGKGYVLNVLSFSSQSNPDHPMNIQSESGELHNITASEALAGIDRLIPELVRRFHPGGIAGSSLTGIGRVKSITINMSYEDLSVRQILNEIAIRSGGYCWHYHLSGLPPQPTWELF